MSSPGTRWRHGRRWGAVGALAAVVVAAAALAVTDPFAAAGSPKASAGSVYPTAVGTVSRRPVLRSQTQVDATLGYAGSYTVVNEAQGVFTKLPSVGQVVRQGQVLYRVSGDPVILLLGRTPAYRTLSDGMTGPDVTELNADLVALGYATRAQVDPRSDYFGLATAYAVERLQDHLGVPETGSLTPGLAVFLPADVRVTALGATTVLAGMAQPGATVLTATSTTPVVTIALDAAMQSEVKVGDRVTIALPSGQTTQGTVSFVGSVATAPVPSAASTGSGTATVTVTVAPADPRAAAGLDQAPVEVSITTASVSDVLAVPVGALLAQPDGGYAVEVTGVAGARHLVDVTAGLIDEADGLVQVSGPGLVAGEHVVVPAT